MRNICAIVTAVKAVFESGRHAETTLNGPTHALCTDCIRNEKGRLPVREAGRRVFQVRVDS